MSSRALLVIDVQNEYFTGALPITHPAGNFDRILQVMDAASENGVPVVVVQHSMTEGPVFRKGSSMWELHPQVAERPRDLLLDKSLPGSFTHTQLEDWLRKRGIDTVTIAGYMTHMCCDTTARQSAHLGFKTEFLSDATGTLDISNPGGEATAEEIQRAILCAQQQFLSEVMPASEWIAKL